MSNKHGQRVQLSDEHTQNPLAKASDKEREKNVKRELPHSEARQSIGMKLMSRVLEQPWID